MLANLAGRAASVYWIGGTRLKITKVSGSLHDMKRSKRPDPCYFKAPLPIVARNAPASNVRCLRFLGGIRFVQN